ncbi:hypothetical protein ACH5RR_036923 [Cinchona calisaya]|uniref:Uncharacterized protein n=1 Tax=Cinchona calisaya TaxID=153742 RepID=A0ABD2Y927_9GENT
MMQNLNPNHMKMEILNLRLIKMAPNQSSGFLRSQPTSPMHTIALMQSKIRRIVRLLSLVDRVLLEDVNSNPVKVTSASNQPCYIQRKSPQNAAISDQLVKHVVVEEMVHRVNQSLSPISANVAQRIQTEVFDDVEIPSTNKMFHAVIDDQH